MKKNLSLIFVIILLQLATENASASFGLSLTPSLLEVHARPGKSISQTFSLKNLADSEKTFVVRVVPFSPTSDGLPILLPSQKPEWLKYFKLKNSDLSLNEPFTIAAFQSRELILTIDIPSRASQSDYYATLLVSSTSQNQSATSFSASIGSNLLITVSPISHPPALVKITEFAPTPDSYLFRLADYYVADSGKPIVFAAVAKNHGKYLTKTSGELTIKGRQVVDSIKLAPLNLLANSDRSLLASPSGELIYRPKISHLGTFTASLDIKSDNGSSHSEITLIVLPFRYLLVLISIILAAFILRGIIKKNAKPDR